MKKEVKNKLVDELMNDIREAINKQVVDVGESLTHMDVIACLEWAKYEYYMSLTFGDE